MLLTYDITFPSPYKSTFRFVFISALKNILLELDVYYSIHLSYVMNIESRVIAN